MKLHNAGLITNSDEELYNIEFCLNLGQLNCQTTTAHTLISSQAIICLPCKSAKS